MAGQMNHQQQNIQLAPRSSHANGTPPEQPLGTMCPSLYLAVYRGRTEEVIALLRGQHGAATDPRDTGIIIHGQCNILEVTAERNSIVHVAAEQGHGELIRELHRHRFMDEGLLCRQNKALDTALHCAARAGHVSSVKALVQLAQECGEGILGKNEAGDTALHLAARHGHGEAVEVLVSAAAELAAQLNNTGMSPLYLAVMSGSVQALRAITGCRDVSSVGPGLQNALHAAVFQSSEMVDLLLGWRPALADEVDSSGSSPLHFASSDGCRAVVNAILRAASPSTVCKKDSVGLSILHVAARMGHDQVVEDVLMVCPHATPPTSATTTAGPSSTPRSGRSAPPWCLSPLRTPCCAGAASWTRRTGTVTRRSTWRRGGPATEGQGAGRCAEQGWPHRV